MKYRMVSLFSGCGGLDLGFELTGHYEVVWANDIYAPSSRTFSKNLGLRIVEDPVALTGTMFYGDVEESDFSELAQDVDVDVITGGPPCQDFSLVRGSGKRKGIHVKRGRLYVHFIRALVTLRPKAFVFENVKGLMSANGGLAYENILKDFKDLNMRWRSMWSNHADIVDNMKVADHIPSYELVLSSVVDFSRLGVPQQRERVIIVGLRSDIAGEGEMSRNKARIKACLEGSRDLTGTFPLTPAEVFTGGSLDSLGKHYTEAMLAYEAVVKATKSSRGRKYTSDIWKSYSFQAWEDYLALNGLPSSVTSETRNDIHARHVEILKELGYYGKPVEEVNGDDRSGDLQAEKEHIKSRMSLIPPGQNHEFVRGTPFEVRGLMSNIYRRIHPLKPSPTIIARGGGGTWGYHYLRDRQRLTNRERARIQTFPDTFLFEGTSQEVRRQIGEAVPPLAAKRIAEAILPVLEKSES